MLLFFAAKIVNNVYNANNEAKNYIIRIKK